MSCHRHKMFFFYEYPLPSWTHIQQLFWWWEIEHIWGKLWILKFTKLCFLIICWKQYASNTYFQMTQQISDFPLNWPSGSSIYCRVKSWAGKTNNIQNSFKENTKICFHFSSHSLEDARHCVGIPEGLLPAFVSHFSFKQVRELSNVRRNLIWKIFPR